MARRYAGVLGPLATVMIITEGLIHPRPCESIALSAWVGLVVFAGVGWLLGWIANRTVEESVRLAIAERLAVNESDGTAT